MFRFDLGVLTSWGSFISAFSLHANFNLVAAPIAGKGKHKFQKVFNRGTIIELFFYILVSSCGYFSLGPNTPKFYAARPNINGGRDYVMLSSCVGMLCVFLIGMNLQINACRRNLFGFFMINDISDKMHFLGTLGIVILVTIVSIFYPFIYVINTVIGGTLTTISTFLVPGIICLLISRRKPKKQIFHFLVSVGFVSLGFFQSGVALLQQFFVFDEEV